MTEPIREKTILELKAYTEKRSPRVYYREAILYQENLDSIDESSLLEIAYQALRMYESISTYKDMFISPPADVAQ